MKPLLSAAFAASLAALAFLTPKASKAEQPSVTVHLQGPEGVRLERRDTPQQAWTSACAAPCDRSLPLDAEYRIVDSHGSAMQGAFHLKGAPETEVVLDVHRASTERTALGAALFVLGAAAVVGSVAATWSLEHQAQQGLHCTPPPGDQYADSCDWSGLGVAFDRIGEFFTVIFGAAGVGAFAAGTYLLATPNAPLLQYTKESPAPEAYVREPTFTARSSAPPPQGVVVPLTFRF